MYSYILVVISFIGNIQQCTPQSFGQSFDCNTAFNCSGQALEFTNATVSGNGYKSLIDSSVRNINGRTIFCNGAYACFNSDKLEATVSIKLLGSNAGENVQQIKVRDEVACYASNGCHNAQIEGSDIQCRGDQSCSQTNMTALGKIEATGAYSLYNSSIVSAGNITIDLQGYYAGYAAKLHCRQDDFCIINCFASACSQFQIECDGTCTVNLNSAATMPPNTNNGETEKPFLYDSYSIAVDSNDECDAISNLKFDDNRENFQQSIDTATDKICCRGSESCGEAPSIVSISAYPTVCSGNSACYGDSNIISNDELICLGAYACSTQSNAEFLTAEGDIYCLGRATCSSVGQVRESIRVNDGQSLYCGGQLSCIGVDITSAGDINVYFLGTYGFPFGNRVTLTCEEEDECNIVCGGYRSCTSDTVMTCIGECNVTCDEDTGCPLIISSTTLQPKSESESASNDQSGSDSDDDDAMNLFFGRGEAANEIVNDEFGEKDTGKGNEIALSLSHSSWICVWALFGCLMLFNVLMFAACAKNKK